MTRPTDTELATALAFVLAKWKEAGADPLEALQFEELLSRMDETVSQPQVRPSATREPLKVPERDQFSDYARPLENDPMADPDPDWAVGTGDRNQ